MLALFTSNSGGLATKLCKLRKDIGMLVLPSITVSKHPDFPRINYCIYAEDTLPLLISQGITHILVVGFPYLISKDIVDFYRGRIWNTHPGNLSNTLGLLNRKVYQKMIDANTLITNISILEVEYGLETGKVIKTMELPITYIDNIKEIVDLVEPDFVNSFLSEKLYAQQ